MQQRVLKLSTPSRVAICSCPCLDAISLASPFSGTGTELVHTVATWLQVVSSSFSYGYKGWLRRYFLFQTFACYDSCPWRGEIALTNNILLGTTSDPPLTAQLQYM
ncbi:hypothetical protein Cflav_PD3926 [Pedosphaera parvula Ellin514]|uniref:Uncharacterized protein n=1 Tax=Pedosphaera parvula (strain Ellin514) TaxID=320771 RepID=B9XG47_PEDPL|nr:hypothetical protein Cflav_PD3926 [Pedosphaera parvula Ellin514]